MEILQYSYAPREGVCVWGGGGGEDPPQFLLVRRLEPSISCLPPPPTHTQQSGITPKIIES